MTEDMATKEGAIKIAYSILTNKNVNITGNE